MDKNNRLYIGIDISKATLDIYWKGKSYKILNNTSAISAFIKAEIAEDVQKILCVMESTGGYERLAFQTFYEAGILTHVAHPNKVHHFAKALGRDYKTDKLDAILLHKYAAFISHETQGDVMHNPKQQQITALRRLSRTVEESLHMSQCRIKQMPESCRQYLQDTIDANKRQIAAIQKDIDVIIDNDPDLKAKRNIMLTMKGVGKKIAAILLAELPELGTLSREQIASLAGVAPRTHQSGQKSCIAHISGGRFYVRKALYMLALVAARYNLIVKQKYKQMVERGKAKKVALVALMRDSIIALNAMIKKMEPFNLSA
jgi:transposase